MYIQSLEKLIGQKHKNREILWINFKMSWFLHWLPLVFITKATIQTQMREGKPKLVQLHNTLDLQK